MRFKPADLELMSVEELWELRSKINSALESRITAEKTKLERRLQELQSSDVSNESVHRERRPYPKVFPKYRNPERPAETWSGRGKKPRWLTAQIKSGRKIDDFRIKLSNQAKRRG